VADSKVYIYALCEPDTHEIRYVGKAQNLHRRLNAHINEKCETRKCRWLQTLTRENVLPYVLVIQETTKSNWEQDEIWWIAYCKRAGYNLTNHTTGGEGVTEWDNEARARLSTIRKEILSDPEYYAWFVENVARSPERCAKISASHKGKKHSLEHVAKLPQNQKGHVSGLTEKQKKIFAERMHGNKFSLGIKPSEETKRKISLAIQGRKYPGRTQTPESNLKRSQTQSGIPKSMEWRQKASQAAYRRWAREHHENDAQLAMEEF
jgi:hypothetical protein